MFVGGHVDFLSFVWESKFGEGDADFDSVGSLRGVEGYVWNWAGGRHVDVSLLGGEIVRSLICNGESRVEL